MLFQYHKAGNGLKLKSHRIIWINYFISINYKKKLRKKVASFQIKVVKCTDFSAKKSAFYCMNKNYN